MPETKALLADPRWLPHRYDAQGKQVQFIRLEREQVVAATFLADIKDEEVESAWSPVSELEGAPEQDVIPQGSAHFIFHTAFVRSTLLTRAVNWPGVSLGLSEPQVLNDLAAALPTHRGEATRLLPVVLALLGRPWAPGEAVVIKPSNAANALIPAMLTERPEARAIMLSGPLVNFLRSVHKKGMMGRRWARRLYAHVQSFAPLDLGMASSDSFESTDLQFAGLAWFLQQRHFAMLLGSDHGERMRSLDADAFNANRGDTLGGLARLFTLDVKEEQLRATLGGPVFSTHAKKGGDVGERLEAEAQAADSAVVEEEIAMVEQWIGQIAAQAGVGALQRPLF